MTIKRIFRLPLMSLLLVLCMGQLWFSPSAIALTPVRLFDLTYEACGEGGGYLTNSGSSTKANCYLIKGKAENKSGKNVVDADIFGRIFDRSGEPVMQNRGRIGTILEVPPGVSDFEFQISVPAVQKEPLTLKNFKASGFSRQVRPFYYDNEDGLDY